MPDQDHESPPPPHPRPAAMPPGKIGVALARTAATPAEAEAQLQLTLEAEPDNAWAALGLAELLLRQERGTEALDIVTGALARLTPQLTGRPDQREQAGRARPQEESPPWVDRVVRQLGELDTTLFNIKIYHGKQLRRELLSQERFRSGKRLAPHGSRVYSKHDDDGIITEIFARIGTTNRYFVEFGTEAYENNTLNLVLRDWRGLWIDGNPENVAFMRETLRFLLESGQIDILFGFISRENINELIASRNPPGEPDFCSIDIDGNDIHVWEALTCIRPRVVCIEYNAKFPPPLRYKLKYSPEHVDSHSETFGASLSSICDVAQAKGYCLVGCNIVGLNAFFVREDLVGTHFEPPFTAENHYEPANYDIYFGLGPRYRPSFAPYDK